MFETMINIIYASWDVLLESSVFVLFGFFIAGMLKAFIPDDFIQRHLGKGKTSSVFKASLFGIPIPLCSCGVIPAAAGLKEQGASKGAVSSFMISTPETGVDSIAVTYALLDPVMTVIRPLSAFLTASLTGIVVNIFDKLPLTNKKPLTEIKTEEEKGATDKKTVEPKLSKQNRQPSCSCSGSCSTSSDSGTDGIENDRGRAAEFNKAQDDWPDEVDKPKDDCLKMEKNGLKGKFKKGMDFAFGELLGDIGPWLLAGIMLAGVITVFVTPGFIESYLGDGIFSMVIMIALATPLYVCATASTPIAAALALKGLSPGAALVFLLAGPATNVATITVASRLLGKKATAIYLASIMGCSLLMGMLTNWIYGQLGLDIAGWVNSDITESHGIVSVIASVVLLILVLRPFIIKAFHPGDEKSHSHCHCHH
ncbi:MAG: SO_0444 family Cu/Zn efflux transporter [Desulfamplus sp.]|nr:SO_0444 family Cu/Zn efflux transporter [Desulfamplus sp.]